MKLLPCVSKLVATYQTHILYTQYKRNCNSIIVNRTKRSAESWNLWGSIDPAGDNTFRLKHFELTIWSHKLRRCRPSTSSEDLLFRLRAPRAAWMDSDPLTCGWVGFYLVRPANVKFDLRPESQPMILADKFLFDSLSQGHIISLVIWFCAQSESVSSWILWVLDPRGFQDLRKRNLNPPASNYCKPSESIKVNNRQRVFK